jgi:hypothetical protein
MIEFFNCPVLIDKIRSCNLPNSEEVIDYASLTTESIEKKPIEKTY